MGGPGAAGEDGTGGRPAGPDEVRGTGAVVRRPLVRAASLDVSLERASWEKGACTRPQEHGWEWTHGLVRARPKVAARESMGPSLGRVLREATVRPHPDDAVGR
jgi:hypothetical protein